MNPIDKQAQGLNHKSLKLYDFIGKLSQFENKAHEFANGNLTFDTLTKRKPIKFDFGKKIQFIG